MDARLMVLLVGSCVSRDTYSFLDPGVFGRAGYVARQSLVSAFGATGRPVIDPADLTSRFQRQALAADAVSSLPDVVREAASEVDLLVWDLVDERLGVHLHHDGGVTTDSVEVRRVLGRALPEGVERLAFGTQEHLRRFTEALTPWRELLEETGLLGRTVLLAPPWADLTDADEPVPDSFGTDALEGNALTGAYVDAVVRVLDVPVVGRSGPSPRAGSAHQWGPAPFHYDDDTYLRLADEIVAAARVVHGDAAVAGRGTRVPSATQRAPRTASPAVSLSRSGDGLAVALTDSEARAWLVHLYRDDERVGTTSWVTERVVHLPLSGAGVYRARAHLLARGGDRTPVASPPLRVP